MLVQIVTENGQKKIKPLTADVGAGNPVGTIIVVCSNILPSGYLGLGVQYDITNYPALYQVLGTDTTPTASALGLPTLSSGQYAIKATSGLAENQQENVLNATKDYVDNSNSYSTDETLTGGKWIDGKPIYRKVYYRLETTPFQYDSITLESGFTNTKNLIKAEGTVKLNNDNVVTLPYIDASDTMEIFIDHGNLNTFTINNAYNVYFYRIIVEYTKTTD